MVVLTFMNLEYDNMVEMENITLDLPDDHEIYEVGFIVGAVNNEGSVTYTHTDEITQTDTISRSSMYQMKLCTKK